MAPKLIGFILRHGETVTNAEEKVRGWMDSPLNQTGMAQAHAAKKFLGEKPLKFIYCSPLLRAFMTADIASAPHKLMVYQHRGMLPWNTGMFAGMSKEDTKEAVKLFVGSRTVEIPNGESLEAFESRIFAFFGAALKLAQKNGLTLWVCHNSTITALAHMMVGPDANHLEDTVKPGGIAEIWFDGKYHTLKPVFGQPEASTFGVS